MTPFQTIIIVLIMDVAFLLITWHCYRAVRRAYRLRDLMIEKLQTATRRFANTHRADLAAIDNVYKALDDKTAELQDVRSAMEYKDKQISVLCGAYKKQKNDLQDLQVTHNHLIGQYNSLLDRIAQEGQMPT